MCLAEPLEVIEVEGSNAVVKVEGKRKKVDASLLIGLKRGDYVLLHDRLAIQKLDPQDTKETMEIIRQIDL